MPDERKSSAAAACRRPIIIADIAAWVEGNAAILNADFDPIGLFYNRKRQFRPCRACPMFNDISDNLLNNDRKPGAGIVADFQGAEVTDELRRQAKRMADRLPIDREPGRNPGIRVIVNHPDWF